MYMRLSNRKTWGSELQKISKSANGMFVLVLILLLTNLIGWVAYIKASQRYMLLVTPPSVSAPFQVSDSGVDASYLKQMSLFFINTRLNFTDKTISGVDQIILENTDSAYYASLKAQLLKERSYIKAHAASSYFVVSKVRVDPNTMSAIISGNLKRWVGVKNIGSESKAYRIKFSYDDQKLKIKSFEELSDANVA